MPRCPVGAIGRFDPTIWGYVREGDTHFDLNDLRSPPGNRLEALSRDRDGQHSIRVNDQFRVCFIWTEEGPKDVEITDYH